MKKKIKTVATILMSVATIAASATGNIALATAGCLVLLSDENRELRKKVKDLTPPEE